MEDTFTSPTIPLLLIPLPPVLSHPSSYPFLSHLCVMGRHKRITESSVMQGERQGEMHGEMQGEMQGERQGALGESGDLTPEDPNCWDLKHQGDSNGRDPEADCGAHIRPRKETSGCLVTAPPEDRPPQDPLGPGRAPSAHADGMGAGEGGFKSGRSWEKKDTRRNFRRNLVGAEMVRREGLWGEE